MKMTMKWAALAACVLAMVSCQENLQPEVNVPEKGAVSFKATAEYPATKTALNDTYQVLWQNGDKIKVKDGSGNVSQYETANSASATAEFNFVEGSGTAAAGGPYEAWYPATLFDGTSQALPAVQQYVANNISEAPMYATSSDHSLAFKNLCGIIRLKITTDVNRSVSKIVLSDTNKGLSGAFTVGSDGAAVVSGTDGVTLDCGTSGAAIGTTATNFLIAVPAGSYEHLKITVVATDGSVQTRTTKSGTSITVERNKITDITLTFSNLTATKGSADIIGDIPQGWVQLWPGGPKWAEFNVGSTISTYAGVTSYTHPDVIGGYYAFKGRYDSKIGSTGGVEDSYGTDDTAAYLWGVNWRTPTYDEELALINNCTWTYCDGTTVKFAEGCTLAGWKVSGKDDGYTENAIFLPLAGDIDYNAPVPSGMGSFGGYYSSYYVETNGYFLNLNSSGQAIASHFPNIGDCVRAVCVDNVDYNYEDLSASRTANCYIVREAGNYKFNAKVKGNGAANLAGINKDTPYSAGYSASLVWATYGTNTVPGEIEFIRDIFYDSEGYICFSTGFPFREGNALVALKDGSGTILWSWHLWFTDDNLVEQTYPGGAIFMDRNLGALSTTEVPLNYGLLYQWGRKDPFLNTYSNLWLIYGDTNAGNPSAVLGTGNTREMISTYNSSVLTKTVNDAVQNPTAFYYPYMTNQNITYMSEWASDMTGDLWGATKTIFDPCPPGWKTPSLSDYDDTFTSQFLSNTPNKNSNNHYSGLTITNGGTNYYFPFSAFRIRDNLTSNSGRVYYCYGSGVLARPQNYQFHLWANDGLLVRSSYTDDASSRNMNKKMTYAELSTASQPGGITRPDELCAGFNVRCVKE